MVLILSDITNTQSSHRGEQQAAVTKALKVVSTVTSGPADDSQDGPDWGARLGLNYSETPIAPQRTESRPLLARSLAPQLPVFPTASPAAENPTSQEAAEHRTPAGSGRQQQTQSTSLQFLYQDYCTPQQARSARSSSSRVHYPYEPPGDTSSSTAEVTPWTKDLANKYLPSPEPWEEGEGEGEDAGSYQHAAAQAARACSISPAATSPLTGISFVERINACAPKGASCSPPAISPPAYVSSRHRGSVTQGRQADGNLRLSPTSGPFKCAVMPTPGSSPPGAQESPPAPSAWIAGASCSSNSSSSSSNSSSNSSSSSMADHWEMGASELTVHGIVDVRMELAADGTGTLSLRAQLPPSAQQGGQHKLADTRCAISTSGGTVAQSHTGSSACTAALAAQDSGSMAAAGNLHAGTSAPGLQACACPHQQDSAAQAANSMAAMSAAGGSTVLLAEDPTADARLHGSSAQCTQLQNEPGLMQRLLTPVRKAGQALLQVLPAALRSPQGLLSSNSSSNSKEGNGCSPPGHEDQLQRSSSGSSSGAAGCSGNSGSSGNSTTSPYSAATGSSAGSLANPSSARRLCRRSRSSGSSSSKRPGELGSAEFEWRVEQARINVQRLHQEASAYFDRAEQKKQCSWRCYYDGYTWGYEQNWNQCAEQADKGVQQVRRAEEEVQELLEAVQRAGSLDDIDPSLEIGMLHQERKVYILAGEHNERLAEVCRRLKVLGGKGDPNEPARIARDLFAIAKQKRAEAAQLAARVNNPLASVTPLDLHGQPVQDALTLVQQQLPPLLEFGRGHPVGVLWEIIVGQGLHSSNGEATMKAAVLDFLQKQQPISCAADQPFTFEENPFNKGRIQITVESAKRG